MAGRERRRGECQNALGFVLARKRRSDLGTVRAVAERRPSERSGVDERCAAIHTVLEGSKEGVHSSGDLRPCMSNEFVDSD